MKINITITAGNNKFGSGFDTNQLELDTKLELYKQTQKYILCVARLADRVRTMNFKNRTEWCSFVNKYRRLFMKDIDSNNIYTDIMKISDKVFLTPNKQNFYGC